MIVSAVIITTGPNEVLFIGVGTPEAAVGSAQYRFLHLRGRYRRSGRIASGGIANHARAAGR